VKLVRSPELVVITLRKENGYQISFQCKGGITETMEKTVAGLRKPEKRQRRLILGFAFS
jgi:hypothetical protein